MPSMTVNILDGIDILEPPDSMLARFEEQVGVYFAQIKNLIKQNDLAIEARDRLLPKLMAGEIEL